MHEIRIAEDLAEIVLKEAQNGNLTNVSAVNICFGELVQIVPDVFRFAFETIVRNTIAEKSEINIEIIRTVMKCKNCGHEFPLEGNEFICNECHSDELDILHGKELFIKSIEGD